jgi:hypothetical protein
MTTAPKRRWLEWFEYALQTLVVVAVLLVFAVLTATSIQMTYEYMKELRDSERNAATKDEPPQPLLLREADSAQSGQGGGHTGELLGGRPEG